MLSFNQLLTDAGIDPADVRLLRHAPKVEGQSLVDLWRADEKTLRDFQAIQPAASRSSFARTYWASFIGTWDGRTMFAGLYQVLGREEMEAGGTDPFTGRAYEVGTTDAYITMPAGALYGLRGRLFVEWGGGSSGKLAWNQRADAQDKAITELHLAIADAPFPGLLAINTPLSHLDAAPPSWIEHLSAAKGVYLLSCPRDGSLYVGSATGAGGFWARWRDYRTNGHGGNVALIGRDPSDFYATILEVAGSAATADDIIAAEGRWKDKLKTRVWGLNRNG